MPRATIMVDANLPAEREAAKDWLRRWWTDLSIVGDNAGRGGNADIWNVYGPQEAIDQLPLRMCANSPWTRRQEELKSRNLRGEFPDFPAGAASVVIAWAQVQWCSRKDSSLGARRMGTRQV